MDPDDNYWLDHPSSPTGQALVSNGVDPDVASVALDKLSGGNVLAGIPHVQSSTLIADPTSQPQAAPAPAATPAAPAIPTSPITTSATPSPSPAAPAVPPAAGIPGVDAGSGDDVASLKAALGSAGTDDDNDTGDDQAQAIRDNNANLRAFKAQGGATQITPTGQEAPAYDAQGNPLYKAKVLDPAATLDDGQTYRVSRDQYGNQHYFRLLDGDEGQDYHTAADGTQYTTVSGADGTSRRLVLGTDQFRVAANTMGGIVGQYQGNAQAAGDAVDSAQNGVAGADGLGTLPLANIKAAHAALTQDLTQAQQTVDYAQAKIAAYTSGQSSETLTPAELTAYGNANTALQQYGSQADALAQEIGTRESAITQARQQRDTSLQAMRGAAQFRNLLDSDAGQNEVKANLGTVLAGGQIDAKRTANLQSAGLLDQSGSVSDSGRALLNGGRTPPPAVAQAPDPSAPAVPPVPSIPGAGDAASTLATGSNTPAPAKNPPGTPSATPTPGQANGRTPDQPPAGDGSGQGQASAVPAVTPAAPDQPKAVQAFTGQDAPYRVDDQGQLSLDPRRLSDGLLAANKAGLVDDGTLKKLLPDALKAEDAAKAQQDTVADLQAKEASAGNYAPVKAAAFGAAKAGGFLAASAPGAALGAEAGTFGGPFAFATVPAGAIIGGLITGTLGSMAVDKTARALAQNSDTIKSFTDSSDLHPYYDMAGNLVAFAAGLPKVASTALSEGASALAGKVAAAGTDATGLGAKAANTTARVLRGAAENYASNSGGLVSTVQNLASDASIRAAGGASAGQIATAIGSRVLGKAAGMVALDTVIKEGSKALGFSNEGQTFPGAVQAALIGSFTSGHDIKATGYDNTGVANIVNAGLIREQAGLSPTEGVMPAGQIPPGTDDARAEALQNPLSAREAEVYKQFAVKLNQLQADGKLPNGGTSSDYADVLTRSSARQATSGGKPYGVTAVDVAPSPSVDPGAQAPAAKSPPNAPLLRGSSDETSAAPLPSAASPSPSSAPPASPAPLTPDGQPSPGERSPSPASIPGVPDGQASPETPAPAVDTGLSDLIQRRDDLRQLLEAGKGSPAEREYSRQMVSFLSQRISEAQVGSAVNTTPGSQLPSEIGSQSPEPSAQPPDGVAPVNAVAGGDRAPASANSFSGPVAVPSSKGTSSEPVTQPVPSWLQDNIRELAGPAEKSGLADKIEQLAAQRQTARQIASTLGTDAETVRAVRVARSIPEWTLSTNHVGGDVENPEFTAWLANRQRTASVESTPSAPPATAPGEPPAPDSPTAPPLDAGELPRPQSATNTPPDETGSELSPSSDASTTSGLVTDHHANLADLINSGETSDRADGQPSTTFQALSKIYNNGGQVTAETARDVSRQVEAIRNDASLDLPSKQTALRQVVLNHSPAAAQTAAPSLPETAAAGAGQTAPRSTLPPSDQTKSSDLPGTAAPAPRATAETLRAPRESAASNVPSAQDSTALSYGKAVGDKLDAKRTAFAPDSGTLGIPRDQMPQVAAEHRGALANFLQARGISWSNADVSPGSLRPSQADFNPGKVEKARSWVGDSERRILTSSDGHVIDGHHQWLARLQDHPDEPMSVVRLNAPAKDILSQVHEFPSAGMEKAPDLSERIAGPAKPTDTPAITDARSWLADERQAGRDPTLRQVLHGRDLSAPEAQRVINDQRAAEQQAAATSPQLAPSTPGTKAAQRAVDSLTAKQAAQNGFLEPSDRQHLANMRAFVERDLNRQALGADPQPTTAPGKQALARNQFLQSARDTGAQLSPSEHAEFTRNRQVLESDFTAQRRGLEAKGAQAPAPAATENKAAKLPVGSQDSAAAPPSGLTPIGVKTPAAPFRRNQEVTYQGRRGVVEQSTPERTIVRLKAGPDPKTGVNLLAKRVTVTDASKITAVGKPTAKADTSVAAGAAPATATPAEPISSGKALRTAQAGVKASRTMLSGLGVARVEFGPTAASSGIEFQDNGTLRISPEKLARSLSTVRDNQARLAIDSTPEDYFAQVLAHEAIHAADVAVAKANGQTIQERYEALPTAALPAGWNVAGKHAYGAENWDALPEWKQKAEFVRQVIEGKWTGRITEQLYKFVKAALDYLKKVAGFEGADPRFRAHVEEVEQRIAAVQGTTTKAPRTFTMPEAPTGTPDALDHIRSEGGIVSPARARDKATFSKYQGDYDGAPDLKGYYHHAVYRGGQMMPDQMAQTLHENYGVGDGSVDGMWKAIQQAKDLRGTVRAQQESQATQAKQAGRFDKDALAVGTAKGKQEINTGSLAVGDKITVGDQTLKVTGIDPDTLDVTLEDHSRYGVQTVADNTALYVEKVEPGSGEDASLAAARPDEQTGRLFGDDEPFELRAESAADAERVLAARRQGQAASGLGKNPPTLRPGEKGTGDLFQGDDQPFNLAGETAIDHAARQRAQEQETQNRAEVQAAQDRAQGSLFAATPEPVETAGVKDASNASAVKVAKALWRLHGVNSPVFRKWFGDWKKDPTNASKAVNAQGKPLVLYHGSPALAHGGGFNTFNVPKDAGDLLAGSGIYLTDNKKLGQTYTLNRDEMISGGAATVNPSSVPDATPVMRLYANIRKPLEAGAGGLADAQKIVAAELAKQPPEPPLRQRDGTIIQPLTVQERAREAVESNAAVYPEDDPLRAYKVLRDALSQEGVIQPAQYAAGDELRDVLQAHGYDGIRHAGGVYGGQSHDVWIAFDPAQVKSAEPAGSARSNSGEFSPSNPSTLAAAEPEPASGQSPDPSRAGSIKDLVDRALTPGSGERKQYASLGTVSPEQAARLKADTGLDLGGYQHNLDNMAVRHVWREHGDPAAETARGNAPLTPADFEKLPQVLAAPDATTLAGRNSRGQDVIMHAKRENGYYIVAEEVRDARGILSVSTLYKKSAPPLARTADGAPDAALLQSNAHAILRQAAASFNFLRGANPATGTPAQPEPTSSPARVKVPRQPGDTDKMARARQWLADERQAGRNPTPGAITRRTGARPDAAARIIADHDAAEAAARNNNPPAPQMARRGDGNDTLAAATPEAAVDPNEEALFGKAGAEPASPPAVPPKFGTPAWAKAKLADLKEAAAARTEHNTKAADLRAGNYAADTRAAESGLQAHSSIGLDIPDERDRQAAGAVVEAGGRHTQLAADLEKVKASPDKKLAAEYTPIYQHALNNLPRLQEATEGWNKLKVAEDAAAEKAGLPPNGEKRMQAVHDDPLSPESTLYPDKGFGATRGYKTQADAIAAGIDPKSTDLADLARHYVEGNRRAINQAEFLRDASAMKGADGKALLAPIESSESKLNANGSVTPTAKVPKGYEAVQAGPNTLAVHKEFAPVFKAMYGDSLVQKNAATRALLKLATFSKKNTLVFETYHLCRLAATAGLGYGMIDYRDGAAAAKYRLEDLDRAVKAGALTKEQAKSVRDSYAVDDKLMRAGMTVGKYADAMTEQAHGLLDHVPGVGPAAAGFNRWMFGEVQRGYIRQAGRQILEHYEKNFPELSEAEMLRRTVKEVGNMFGDPAHTSIFQSKTMQDAANIIGFSPRWTEGKLKTELHGFVQAAKIPVDLLRGRGVRAGNVARAMGTLLLGSLVGAQLLNLLSRGKLTFQNPEDDHKWDAWLPGGPHNKGFWFSPLSIGAEFVHGLHKYMAGGDNALDAVTQIASNKLSAPARGAKDLLTGKDWRGQPFGGLGERAKAAAIDTLPSPLPLSGVLQKDPHAPLGYTWNHEQGSLEKQGLSMVGLKVDAAQSARSQMFDFAKRFRADGGANDATHAPSAYATLRHALDNENAAGVKAEIERLVTVQRYPLGKIAAAMGIKDGAIKPERYTDGNANEEKMKAALTPAQRQVYDRAQAEHADNARLFAKYLRQLLDDPAKGQALLTVSKANGSKPPRSTASKP